MRSGLKGRVIKLEQQQEAEHPTYSRVLWIGLDGLPDPPEQNIAPEGPLVILPRKAASAEEWYAHVRTQWEGRDAAAVAQSWWDARPWLEAQR